MRLIKSLIKNILRSIGLSEIAKYSYLLWSCIKSYIAFIINLPKFIKNIILMHQEYEKRFKGLKVGLFQNMAVGPMAIVTDFYLRKFRAYNYDPHNDVVLIGTSTVSNYQLQKMFKRTVNIQIDDALRNIIDNGGKLYLEKTGKFITDGFGDWSAYWHPFYSDCPINIDFTEEEIKYGKGLLKKIGIDEKDVFVHVHNRDDFYWLEVRGVEKPFWSYRNSDFKTLLKSISYLKKQGIKVIRGGHYRDVGKPSYISLNVLTEKEKDFADIYIQRYCLFSVNGVSGTSNISLIFKKPILIHNAIPWGLIPVIERGILIPKKLMNKNNKKFFTISELFKIKQLLYFQEPGEIARYRKISAHYFHATSLYNQSDIEIHDNSEDEILNAVKEMLKLIKNGFYLTDQEKELQLKFKRLFPVKHPCRHMKGIISPSFLAKYQEILN